MKRNSIAPVFTFLAMTLACVLPTKAAEFASKKIVTFYVGHGAGTTIDMYARVIGRVLSKHLPSETSIVVSNMPGAGGIAMVNFLEQSGHPDGSVWGFVNRSVVLAPILKVTQAGFDPLQLKWLGSPSKSPSVGITRAPAQDAPPQDNAHSRQITLGGTSPTQDNILFPRAMNEVAGTNFKIVSGYKSPRDIENAIERGEVDGSYGTSLSSVLTGHLGPDLKAGRLRISVQFGTKRHPLLPDVPLAIDSVRNAEDREFLSFLMAPSELGYPIFLPRQTTPEALATARTAFRNALADPELINLIEKSNLDLNPIFHEALEATLRDLASASPTIIARARRMMELN